MSVSDMNIGMSNFTRFTIEILISHTVGSGFSYLILLTIEIVIHHTIDN
jgi:hypothetical protein